ncbi:MAG: ABC transporter permease subunit [Acidimicrobiia bacterium]|nr:ABC transporter permease subunit [Acidimicrobiia bacterium]
MNDEAGPPAATPTAPAPSSPPSSREKARIYEQGFRRYVGPRTGTNGALRSLIKHSLRQTLGIGRSARYKMVPLPIIFMAFVPAIGLITLAALIPVGTEEFLPTYAEYYALVVAALYLFAGLICPEMLCDDRRTGMLGVYLSSPLDRPRYLLGKAMAVLLLLLVVTLGPPLLTLIAFTLQNEGPSGFVEWITVFLRILASSAVVGAIYGAVGLAISASTDRRVVATAAILSVIPGSAIVTDILVNDGGLPPVVRLANVMFLPRALVHRIHREFGGWPLNENPTWTLWLAFFGWLALCTGWIWYRYRNLMVRP